MTTERARKWYEERRKALRRMYWSSKDPGFHWPNGFKEYPHEIYQEFAKLIHRNGKVIDLGCGNALLLRHLLENTGYKLEPYGVDFLEESIKQAKTEILPEYAQNFVVSNIVEYKLPEDSFDFIIVDPTSIHKDDIDQFISMLLKACRSGGRIIFYAYRDVLKVIGLLSIIANIVPPLRSRLPWKLNGVAKKTSDLLPPPIRNRVVDAGNREVSIAVYDC